MNSLAYFRNFSVVCLLEPFIAIWIEKQLALRIDQRKKVVRTSVRLRIYNSRIPRQWSLCYCRKAYKSSLSSLPFSSTPSGASGRRCPWLCPLGALLLLRCQHSLLVPLPFHGPAMERVLDHQTPVQGNQKLWSASLSWEAPRITSRWFKWIPLQWEEALRWRWSRGRQGWFCPGSSLRWWILAKWAVLRRAGMRSSRYEEEITSCQARKEGGTYRKIAMESFWIYREIPSRLAREIKFTSLCSNDILWETLSQRIVDQ